MCRCGVAFGPGAPAAKRGWRTSGAAGTYLRDGPPGRARQGNRMTRQSPARRLFASLITAATFAALPIIGAPAALAQPAADAPAPAAQIATVGDLSRQGWSDARSGRMEEAIKSLRALPEDSTDPSLVRLRSLPEMLEQNRAKQAEERAAKIAEAEESLAAELAKPETASTLSAALKHAVELHVLALPEDKDAILAQPRIREP